MSASVIAAIDLGPLTGRVLFHAAAFARLLQAPLKILHVNGDRSPEQRQRVLDACLQLGPYQADFDESQIVLRAGRVSDAIVREAHSDRASLIVIGSRGHSGVAKLLLGSTSDGVLRNAEAPVLVVPSNDIDIVSIGDHVSLTCGPIVAAVDLAEDSTLQLRLAGKLAQIGALPLLLMTVAKARVTDHDAAEALRKLAHGLNGTKPRELIVRRGAVADEISRCAIVEGAGLVVMGLRPTPRGRPGTIASAVLRTRRAFVLAVPGVAATIRRSVRTGAAVLATACIMLAAAASSLAQDMFPDERALLEFQRAADSYAFLHRQVERRLNLSRDHPGPAELLPSAELAAAIVDERSKGRGPALFTPNVAAAFRQAAAYAVRDRRCDAGELRTGAWELQYRVHSPATGARRLTACLAAALPALPPELEYRSAGTVLLVADPHANLVVDVLPALLAGSELR